MTRADYKTFCIQEDAAVRNAMKQLDETAEKILFVTDPDDVLIGSLTDGDIRRWILSGGDLNEPIYNVCNTNPITGPEGYDADQIRRIMLKRKIECIPIVNSNKKIVELLFWEKLLGEDEENASKRSLDVPVVIMAGGRGTRLDPFTRVLPKPLIPIGDRTIIELIIERFRKFDVSNFFLSVNHKSKLIKSYFEEIDPSYRVSFVEEEKPLGTAGSLHYLRDSIVGHFFVTNCDIIIEGNYPEMLDFHREQGNAITIIASMKNYNIPYGICEIVNGGKLVAIREKPAYDFLVNTGMYILDAKVLDHIPKETFFHITTLVEKLVDRGEKVSVFPVSDKAWIDIGQWTEYRNALDHFEQKFS